MRFADYKDFNDFIAKNNFTIDEGLESLDNELKKRRIMYREGFL